MSTIDGIPWIVLVRWRDALLRPDMCRWHSLARMLGSMYVNISVAAPNAPQLDDVRTLSDVAYRHALDMQPAMEAA